MHNTGFRVMMFHVAFRMMELHVTVFHVIVIYVMRVSCDGVLRDSFT